MANPKLTDAIIDAAILGFEEQKRKIDEQIAELRTMRGGTTATESSAGRPRRKMSAATRRAMGEAQRKRWAEKKAGATTSPVKAAEPLMNKKRVLSAAGKAAIVAALKKRWAAKKAAAKK